jgi:hypothetical protein
MYYKTEGVHVLEGREVEAENVPENKCLFSSDTQKES